MNKLSQYSFGLVSKALMRTSCGDDDTNDDTLAITGNEAAEFVAASLALATKFEGEIIFQEDNTRIATFSTSEQYEIDLNTGVVKPI